MRLTLWAGRAKTTSAQHYVLHDLKSFTDKYVESWSNFGIGINGIALEDKSKEMYYFT